MDNPLKKFFDLNKLFGGGDGSALGIDVGSSAIKIVEIKKKGSKAVLETYGAIALGPYDEQDAGRVTNLSVEKISEALKEVLKQSGVTTNNAAFSIPVQSSLIFSIDLPQSIKEKDMGSIVETEARKYIPVPINEVSVDYFMLPKKEPSFMEMNVNTETKSEPEKLNVLVVATQNDAVSKFRAIVSNSGLTSSFFEIEIFSSIRANFEHELSSILLIDFGASYTKVAVVEFGMVKTYHTINRGGADITDAISKSLGIPFDQAEKMKKDYGLLGNSADKNLAEIIRVHTDYMFAEANNVLLSYEKKYNRIISKVIFTGGGAMLKGLPEVAANNFRAPIQIGHPFGKVSAPSFLDKVLENLGPEFAVAIGVALRKLQ